MPFLSPSAHLCHPAPLFVILSEAKDLPSGVRLWKTLRQAQGDKAILSLGRCFDRLSMTKQRRQRRKRPARICILFGRYVVGTDAASAYKARMKHGFLYECANALEAYRWPSGQLCHSVTLLRWVDKLPTPL